MSGFSRLDWLVLSLSIVSVFAIPRTGLAQQITAPLTPGESVATAEAPPQADSTAPSPSQPRPNVSSQTSGTSSYLLPIVDIVTFDFLLNRYGSRFVDRHTFDVGFSSIKRNVSSRWVVDNDPFTAGIQDETTFTSLKEISITAQLASPSPGWQTAVPATVVLRRVKAN